MPVVNGCCDMKQVTAVVTEHFSERETGRIHFITGVFLRAADGGSVTSIAVCAQQGVPVEGQVWTHLGLFIIPETETSG